MAIRLALSALTCPSWPLEKVVEQAKAGGYAGVELAALGPGTGVLASDPTLIDPAHVRQLFAQAGLSIAALSIPLSLALRDNALARSQALQAEHFLDLAKRLGCPLLNLKGQKIEPGQNLRQVLERIAQRSVPLVQRARELGVQLIFENGGDLPVARDWWTVLELVSTQTAVAPTSAPAATTRSDGTPSAPRTGAGMCWNLATAAAAGENLVVSVPMLHSRIRLAKISDFATDGPRKPVQLGDGTTQPEEFIKRLLGIGYQGFVSVEWPGIDKDASVNAEQFLVEARQRIQGWMDAVAKSIEDAKPKPKPAKPHPGAATPAKPATTTTKPTATAATPAPAAPAVSPQPAPPAAPAAPNALPAQPAAPAAMTPEAGAAKV